MSACSNRYRILTMLLADVVWLSVGACGPSATPPRPPPHLEIGRRPPPPPGTSLSRSKLCTCHSCEPASCCAGPGDEAATGACDGDDFSAPGCGIRVESCAARCFEHSWRVPVAESCSARRPPVCCEGREASPRE
ncbi:MAG: hypothetical protein JW751_17790 [Polyangiaceae bacterium]|nr:hypothetical protein [Polyangiaceae bacterium]